MSEINERKVLAKGTGRNNQQGFVTREGLGVTRCSNRGGRSRRIGTCRAFLAFPGKSLKFIMEEARSVKKRKKKEKREKKEKEEKAFEFPRDRILSRDSSGTEFQRVGADQPELRHPRLAAVHRLSALRSADRSPFENLFRPAVPDGYCPACCYHPRVALPRLVSRRIASRRVESGSMANNRLVCRSLVRANLLACLLAPCFERRLLPWLCDRVFATLDQRQSTNYGGDSRRSLASAELSCS